MWRNRLLYMVGAITLILSLVQLLPLVVALILRDTLSAGAFFTSFILSTLTGGALYLGFQGTPPVRTPSLTVLLPILATLSLAVVAGLPFYFLFPEDGLVPAFFEGMSFITTNGASAYPVSDQSVAVQLWRALIAWTGGFLAIIYALSLLTAVNSGGQQLHYSPLPYGDSREGYNRLYSTSAALFPVYVLVTSVFALFFMLTGVPVFNAFSLAVSGVSTTALPQFGPALALPGVAEAGFVLLMLVGASNWDMLQAQMVGKKRSLLRDPEARLFLLMLGIFFALMLPVMAVEGWFRPWSGLFHLISAASGTGYHLTGDDALPGGTIAFGALIILLTAVGGASIGTTGGIKQLRGLSLLLLGKAELDRLAHPHGARRLHIGRAPLTVRDGEAIYLLVGGFVISLMIGALLLGIQGVPFVDSLALGFAALTLSGPLAETIAPGTIGYTALTNTDYLILSGLMLVGRVEATFMLALFSRIFWRR